MVEKIESRQQYVHDTSRAEWLRGVGAVLMREFTEGAFDETPEFTQKGIEVIWVKAKAKTRTYEHTGISLLWAAAYEVSKLVTEDAFKSISEVARRAGAEGHDSILTKGFGQYTFETKPSTAMYEAESTVAHFPISLAMSVCAHAQVADINNPRLAPASLAEIADLIESPDFRLMVDQSLFAANGFWRGFSTSINDLATTGLGCIGPVYRFTGEGVQFSEKALAALRDSVKMANLKIRKELFDNKREYINTSTSGCPARHKQPSSELRSDTHSLAELSRFFNKHPEELMASHEQSVVQESIEYITKGLRNTSPFIADKIEEEQIRLASLPMRVPDNYLIKA